MSITDSPALLRLDEYTLDICKSNIVEVWVDRRWTIKSETKKI